MAEAEELAKKLGMGKKRPTDAAGGMDALQGAIIARANERKGRFDEMVASLEEKYATSNKARGKRSK